MCIRDRALDDDFKQQHPELIVEKKSDSPDEDKSISDSSSLKPILFDFFVRHPDFHPLTFLGDSAFDSYDTVSYTHLGATLLVLAEAAGQAVGPTCPGIARRFSTSQFYTS